MITFFGYAKMLVTWPVLKQDGGALPACTEIFFLFLIIQIEK